MSKTIYVVLSLSCLALLLLLSSSCKTTSSGNPHPDPEASGYDRCEALYNNHKYLEGLLLALEYVEAECYRIVIGNKVAGTEKHAVVSLDYCVSALESIRKRGDEYEIEEFTDSIEQMRFQLENFCRLVGGSGPSYDDIYDDFFTDSEKTMFNILNARYQNLLFRRLNISDMPEKMRFVTSPKSQN